MNHIQFFSNITNEDVENMCLQLVKITGDSLSYIKENYNITDFIRLQYMDKFKVWSENEYNHLSMERLK